jgi:O-antigen/teichoic acid export membrane protein
MMGYWGQIIETGWYNAAQRVVAFALVPASLIAISFFPVLSKFLGESKEKLQKSWDYFMGIMIFLSVPLVFGGIALASKIIDFVYDPSYFPSILVFQILIITGGITILNIPFIRMLVVFNQQKKFFWIVISGAVLNVILNLILIPKYSLYGAAMTSLIAKLLMFFLFFIFTSKLIRIRSINSKLILTFFIAFISSIIMYLVISCPNIHNLYIVYIVLIGILSYSLIFSSLKKVLRCFIK